MGIACVAQVFALSAVMKAHGGQTWEPVELAEENVILSMRRGQGAGLDIPEACAEVTGMSKMRHQSPAVD